MTMLEKLGLSVKEKRTRLEITQEELANICGFDRTYISLVERGKRNISFTNLAVLASGLQTTVSELTKDL